jgi:hypothetical protein
VAVQVVLEAGQTQHLVDLVGVGPVLALHHYQALPVWRGKEDLVHPGQHLSLVAVEVGIARQD